MITLIYDNNKFVTRMTRAGMPQPQAKPWAEPHAELTETAFVTKQDLKELEGKLASEMTDLRDELTGEMKDLEYMLARKIEKAKIETIVIMTAIVGGLMAVMKLF